MTLQEIFDDLTYGELSQVNTGGAESFGVSVENRKKLVTHVNRGLTVLHRRFRIKMGEMQVPLEAGKREYTLENVESPILKVERIRWPEKLKKDPREVVTKTTTLPLNEMEAEHNILMPSYNKLIVPQSIMESDVKHLDITYRANHPRIDKNTGEAFDPETIMVDMPEVYREPLLYYMAALATNPLGPGIEGFHEGNNYHQKFEMACRAIENQGGDMKESTHMTKFQRNGWV